MVQPALLALTLFVATLQEECKIIKTDKDKVHTKCSGLYNFCNNRNKDFPEFFEQPNIEKTPFTIENNCLSFCIHHEGCDCTFEMYWDGTYRKDEWNRVIVDLKFEISFKDPCRRNNRTTLSFDLSEITQGVNGDMFYINLISYDKLIEISL